MMVETDWKELLSFSQRDLKLADKEKLCESLSWMEADDIELNFTDLKTLFRLAQDILKFKSEQVNNLLGQLETQKRRGKGKVKSYVASPTRSNDSVLDTVADQEELIKANKEILDQMYSDIAELEGKKNKLEEQKDQGNETDSSRDAFSEMNAVEQLENEVTLKNRHIRKLLVDVKVLEDDNNKLKEKLSTLNDKLTEATEIIENLTDQIFTMNNENIKLKENLGESKQTKAFMSIEIESLKKDLAENESKREAFLADVKAKVQHWKNATRTKRAEIEALLNENTKLKEELIQTPKVCSPKRNRNVEEHKMKELQDKLTEASSELIQSAKLIERLKAENQLLKLSIEDTAEYSATDVKNESDEGKERIIINKLRKKVKTLTVALSEAEESIKTRERELIEVSSQLKLVEKEEGIKVLIDSLKQKKLHIKSKNDKIKSLVDDVNNLNEMVDQLQLENESMRLKLNIPTDESIDTKSMTNKYHEIERHNLKLTQELRSTENKLVSVELENRDLISQLRNLKQILLDMGYQEDHIDSVCDDSMPTDGGGEASQYVSSKTRKLIREKKQTEKRDAEMEALAEENEGLRKGLLEILNFLKDNSTSSSGVLTMQCPSLEAVLHSMEARHAAGWFAPHMAAVMELKAALGGRDALLTALHESRKETFDIMQKLTTESKKAIELKQKLSEIESSTKQGGKVNIHEPINNDVNIGEFGSWIADTEHDEINLIEKGDIENYIARCDSRYEDQLKSGLSYFYNKLNFLFNKMTSLTIQSTDDRNNWRIEEEQYKAQIENLKTQIIDNMDDSISENSPGLISIPNVAVLERRCSYLEESFKYIRTLNENIKNEHLDCQRDAMVAASQYESQINRLILTVMNITDKVRKSVSIDLFWKQNNALTDIISKYRKLLNDKMKDEIERFNLVKRLEDDKLEIINSVKTYLKDFQANDENFLTCAENSILQKQLQEVCHELNEKDKVIEQLEAKNLEFHTVQSKLIDENLASVSSKKDIENMNDEIIKLKNKNKTLNEQNQHVSKQLDIALLQLQDIQRKHLNNDIEVNLLKHQILDLQSTGDSKAIVARLSGEVLVAHLQASESHKKIEKLNIILNKERQLRTEAEEMFKARQNIFDVYATRYETKFRYLYEVMQVLRQQYHGCLPLTSIENYQNTLEDLTRKSQSVNAKLNEIEDLQASLMMKHTVFEQILDVSKNKCLEDDDACQHKLKVLVTQNQHSRESAYLKKKIQTLEQSRDEILKHCNSLEQKLLLVNQGLGKFCLDDIVVNKTRSEDKVDTNMELEDLISDDDSISRRSETITLPKPKVLKPVAVIADKTKLAKDNLTENLPGSPVKMQDKDRIMKTVNALVQTVTVEKEKFYKLIQTDEDPEARRLYSIIDELSTENKKKIKEISEAVNSAKQLSIELQNIKKEKHSVEAKLRNLQNSNDQKDKLISSLNSSIFDLKTELDKKENNIAEKDKIDNSAQQENRSLLVSLKKIENDKNTIVEDYQKIINNDRDEFAKLTKDLQNKIVELQAQLERRGSDSGASHSEKIQDMVSKYTYKIAELEDECFNLRSKLDGSKSELTSYQSEVDRWKNLASERLSKMEQLSSQLERRHSQEVESYKAENQHWLSQLSETQREHLELRSKIAEQKALHVKQASDKDMQIEQLRSTVHSLKSQIMSMQTIMAVNDPSFDLSAIVEVEEVTDGSQPGSERLELKFDTLDLQDMHDDMRMPASSTAIWQEPIIERLRREKQLISKQNAMLRRQIKALAARERRARLDAHNLKNQVFRITTSGNKIVTAETAALQNKIASLQAQLSSARRDTNSNVALWDKWKRAQQSSDRWQARYEDKCQDVKKLEVSLNLAKSAMSRLEKDKRVLLNRLSDVKHESRILIEKQEGEHSEKSPRAESERYGSELVSTRALLDRVEAQQRRIAALEVAEQGNEVLVSQYERSLAEITVLKGQVLKLESSLLESQIRTPLKSTSDTQPELEYWKSYCEMLKEETVQMSLKLNALETIPTSAHQHRINDLEQTILTLRGLVSKFQSEQKSSMTHRRVDTGSRPGSAHSGSDKGRSQLESHRVEIANLKRTIQDKDLLLEKSKAMLKIAAEREEDLLKENAFLRRRLDELSKPSGGFMSA